MNPEPIAGMPTRRRFLAGAAVLGAGLGAGFVLAACGGDDDDDAGSGTTTDAATGTTAAGANTTVPGEVSSGDAEIAVLAAGLEALAVGTYQAALDAAGAGALGEVPPAVAEFVTVALAHHQAHLDAWNDVLTGAGAEAVTEPNGILKPAVDAEFAKVTDVTGAAALALTLEQAAAATYLEAQRTLTNKDAILLAGSIQIVDAQHVSILLYVLGEYPVPDVFAKTELAVAA